MALLAVGLATVGVSWGKPQGPPSVAEIPSVRVGEATIPPFEVQRARDGCKRYGDDPSLEECLMKFYVPRWRLDQEAARRKVDEQPKMAHRLGDLLHLALVEELHHQVSAPTETQIARFIEDHPRDFARPLRIRIFRLLTSTKEDATRVLNLIQSPLDVTQFRALCRQHSIDKATHERGGDLGFVWPDGSTDVPQVRAEPALYEAALPLAEGQLLEEPIAEGDHWAIVWRRGSLPAEDTEQSDRERASFLLKERAEAAAVEQLLERLEKERVRNRKDVLLGRLRRKDTGLFVEP